MRVARTAHEETGERCAVLGGGVAMNCVANGRLLREGPFDEIWVQPAAGDAGSALGCALWAWHEGHDGTRPSPVETVPAVVAAASVPSDDPCVPRLRSLSAPLSRASASESFMVPARSRTAEPTSASLPCAVPAKSRARSANRWSVLADVPAFVESALPVLPALPVFPVLPVFAALEDDAAPD